MSTNEIIALATDQEFNNEVSYQLKIEAVQIVSKYDQDALTPEQARRARFARKVLSGRFSIGNYCLAVMTNANLAALVSGKPVEQACIDVVADDGFAYAVRTESFNAYSM